MSLQDHDLANNYTRNRATFNPTDDLILNDGVLWDVNSGKPVHKFDKFNENVSGVFHPMGLEVIINSEVVSFKKSYLWRMYVYIHSASHLFVCLLTKFS